MKFGAFYLLQSPGVRPSAEVYRQKLDLMVYADTLGFDSIWIAEHHFSNYGYSPNPLLLAVKAAGLTKRVRIGTAVLVLPFWHPLRLAEDVAMTDQLTEGRLDVGVARGYQPYEFERFGLDIAHSRERSDETLAVFLQALDGRGIEHRGAHYQVPETTTYPRPLQQPRPPVWLAAATADSFQTAVRNGLNCFTSGSTRPLTVPQESWAHFEAARKAQGVSGPYEFAVQQHVHVAPTDAEARSRLEHSLWHYRHATLLRRGVARVTAGVATDEAVPDEPSLDALWDEMTLAGTAERVRARLGRYRATMGLTQLNCIFDLGSLDGDTVRQSMRLFMEQVAPHFR
jgi:alkanesulfonate monooxygenase SsuD/methylene tetrahydromethanopterin reductase-like flavin-dependent oxidoreductase (luciferase family)